jgi:hypothetical protein
VSEKGGKWAIAYPVDKAIEGVTQEVPYILLRLTSRRQLRGFEETMEERRKKARLYNYMASTNQDLHQNMRGLLYKSLEHPDKTTTLE